MAEPRKTDIVLCALRRDAARRRHGIKNRSARRRRFLGDRRGASAVEFAIVAPVFLALMFSTFEVGWFYFVNSTVDAAATNVARIVRTGQAQQNGYATQADRELFFAEQVCPKLRFLADCDSRLTAEVEAFSSFAELAADTSPITCRDDQPEAIQNLVFDPGTDHSIVRVRLCLLYDTLNPAIGMSLATSESGRRRVTATYVLRVEPYSKNKKSKVNPE